MASPALDHPPRRWTPGRIAVVAIVVGLVAMWGYVLYLAFGPGRQPPADRLEDPAFALAAEERCSAALDEVAALPSVLLVELTPEKRADIVEQANEHFAAMLDDLDALAPGGEDGEVVQAWLADWRTYLGDRQDYVRRLREDPEARLLISPKDNEQVTEFIDAFAKDNQMPACGEPLDVG